MAHPEGVELLKRLVKISDVVVENFSPRVMPKHGLNYEALREIKPDIIMISMSAAGRYGSLRDMQTYAPSLSSLSGLDYLVGYYNERPLGEHTYCDQNSAIHGAFAILSALYYRDNTGHGQYIDMAQWETTLGCIGEAVMEYTMNRRVLGPLGNRHPTMAPHNNYRCKGEDMWVSIAVDSDEEWQGLCQAMGNPPWSKEERFADKFHRLKNREELDRLINEWTINYTHYEVTEILQEAGVAAAPCLKTPERFYDPHFKERSVYIDVDDPRVGKEWMFGIPWKLNRTPGRIVRLAPSLGEHNRYVFGQLLGMPSEEIAELEQEGVIY